MLADVGPEETSEAQLDLTVARARWGQGDQHSIHQLAGRLVGQPIEIFRAQELGEGSHFGAFSGLAARSCVPGNSSLAGWNRGEEVTATCRRGGGGRGGGAGGR